MMNKQTLAALFIIGVMVFSTFGFILSESTGNAQTFSYQGKSFVLTEEGLFTLINNKKIFFTSLPDRLESVDVEDSVKKIFKESPVITISYDPNSEDAELLGYAQYSFEDRSIKIGKPIVINALTNAQNFSLPEITCANSSQTSPVLVFEKSNTSSAQLKNDCVIVKYSSQQDLLEVIDKLVYIVAGVLA